MLTEIRSILFRSQSTLAGDVLGMVSIGVMFFAGLHLPGIL
ncbi:hypothetical protein ACP2AV_07060 [Aliiroseovarius sp. PTFE2010]